MDFFRQEYLFSWIKFAKYINLFNTKKAGGGEVTLTPCFLRWLSKNVSSEERGKPYFFGTFNIIIIHILLENFIEIPQVSQKI